MLVLTMNKQHFALFMARPYSIYSKNNSVTQKSRVNSWTPGFILRNNINANIPDDSVFTSTLASSHSFSHTKLSLLVLLFLLLLFLVFLGFGLFCFVLLDQFLHFLQLQHFDAGLAVVAGQRGDLHWNDKDGDRQWGTMTYTCGFYLYLNLYIMYISIIVQFLEHVGTMRSLHSYPWIRHRTGWPGTSHCVDLPTHHVHYIQGKQMKPHWKQWVLLLLMTVKKGSSWHFVLWENVTVPWILKIRLSDTQRKSLIEAHRQKQLQKTVLFVYSSSINVSHSIGYWCWNSRRAPLMWY